MVRIFVPLRPKGSVSRAPSTPPEYGRTAYPLSTAMELCSHRWMAANLSRYPVQCRVICPCAGPISRILCWLELAARLPAQCHASTLGPAPELHGRPLLPPTP